MVQGLSHSFLNVPTVALDVAEAPPSVAVGMTFMRGALALLDSLLLCLWKVQELL